MSLVLSALLTAMLGAPSAGVLSPPRAPTDTPAVRLDVAGLKARATQGSVSQIIATLVENALHHGGGTVTIRTRTVGGSVVIEVTDEGPGVSEALGTRIFEAGVSGGESTGRGLALARDLARADGARLELVHQRPAVFALFLAAPDFAM